MIAFLSASSPTAGVVAAAVAYLGAGAAVGVALRRARGLPAGTAASALVAWPLLLPLLGDAAPRQIGPGPLAGRIDAAFAALARTLADLEVPWRDDVDRLRAAVDAADARLSRVDRLLADAPTDPALAAGVRSLQDAREHAAGEVLAVLAGVDRLRLELGLLTLAEGGGGDAREAGDALRALLARVSALDETARSLAPRP